MSQTTATLAVPPATHHDTAPVSAGIAQDAMQMHIQALQQQIQNANPNSQGLVDIASVLSKIQSLEKEKAELSQQLTAKDAKLDKLTESKRAEMQQVLQTTIAKFLEVSTAQRPGWGSTTVTAHVTARTRTRLAKKT